MLPLGGTRTARSPAGEGRFDRWVWCLVRGVLGRLDGGADAAAVGDLVAVGAGPLADLGHLVFVGAAVVGRRSCGRRWCRAGGLLTILLTFWVDRSISYWVRFTRIEGLVPAGSVD